MRKLLIFCIVMLFSFVIFAADSNGGLLFTPLEYNFLHEHPEIRIGPDPSFIPFEYIDSHGVYKGIAADILALIEQRTGLRFVLIGNLTWQEVTEKALDRQVDLLPAVGKTIERENIFLFSNPYIAFQRVVVVKNTNESIQEFDDLFGRQVAVQANSSHHGFLNNYPQIGIRTYETVEDALYAVNRGEEVAFIGNEATTSYLSGTLGMTELSFIPIDTGEVQQLYMAVRNDWPQLVSILDKALDSISETELSEIYNRWITIDRRIDFTPYIMAAVLLGAIALLILGVSAFWISRLRREVQKKEEAMELAAEADREKSRFMARMSHEIRTPLNGINGMTYLLEGSTLNPTQKQYVKSISRATKNMLSIINDIIEYSRIEERRIPMENIPFKLDEVVQHVISLESPVIHKKNLKLQFEWDSEVPIHVKGDGNRLGQIITNLIHNAVKFTDRGIIGIRVYCTHLEESLCKIRFEISDTGIGISEETLANLFKPFSQADASIARKYGGSGLGLSIVKSLVEMMGGTLNLSSELGKGSRFSFELPLELDLEGKSLDDQRLASLDLSSLNILVFAKDEGTRKSIEIALHRIGASADYIGKSKLALQLLCNDTTEGLLRYGLLILDTASNGDLQQLLTTLKEVPSKENTPKIIALVSSKEEGHSEELRRSGIDIVLPKPVLPSLLFDSILEIFSKTVLAVQLGDENYQDTHLGERGNILVVEDNEVNRIIARDVLERGGFRIFMAENGKEGYDLFVQQRDSIDLILMDLHMDVMDGFEATRLIRLLDKSVPIFALTADVIGDIHERCSNAGFTRIIPKPYDPKDLQEIIAQTIGKNPAGKATSKQLVDKEDIHEVLNTVQGLNRIDGNDALYEKLVSLFLQEIYTGLPKMQQAFSEEDWKSIAEFAHKTKGGAYTIGADRLGDIARKIHMQVLETTKVGKPLLDEFVQELALLEREIGKFFDSSAPKC